MSKAPHDRAAPSAAAILQRFWWASALLILAAALWSPPGRSAPVAPDTMVRQTTEQVLAALRNDSDAAGAAHVDRLVADIVLPHMDFQRMSRWVLGRYWRRATPAQREQFQAQFRQLLVRTYATALASYKGQTVRYLPSHPAASARDVTVRTEVVQAGGPPIPVSYSVHREADGQWKAYDIVIDGVSLVANYRASFAGQVRAGGLDALIQELTTRNSRTASAL